MVVAVRQYGRWLRDNYADLEHKEVWVSLTLLIGLMLLLMCYEYTDNYVMCTIAHLIGFPLAGLLLWRVETLSDLSADSLTPSLAQSDACLSKRPAMPLCETKNPTPKGEASHIARLLTKCCEGPGLYLQTGPGERLPLLQHLQRSLQAAHAQERHRLDARRGILTES